MLVLSNFVQKPSSFLDRPVLPYESFIMESQMTRNSFSDF